ncbi:hypothetical protein IPA_04870 [Ignicoccus pacificus DSM 13166]|uniref:Uncharacterized protein n=1 Tax=Ignicoccus pacificus DSM 13166 TaxID=940294 RepID=A0A977KCS0_9CREN|nr:hypothetical protein IPA_04870 [Ignicoccus pacificus DSM 13166]
MQTGHWPYEIQIAQMRKEKGLVTVPPIYEFKDPALGIAALGFAILRMPNGELNPHGWWLYAPNALSLMRSLVIQSCQLEPAHCMSYLKNFQVEIEKVREVLKECVPIYYKKKVVVMMPVEQYALANFEIKVLKVVQSKGAILSGRELREAVDALKKSDALVISEVSKNVPATKIMETYARRLHKPVIEIKVMWGNWKSYDIYLKQLCTELRELR